ncbi:aldehyde dehydrogenase [Aureococcus anophagefferens]|nr:aldehyde dehydrogenase [Aureococcus anophagefferens]
MSSSSVVSIFLVVALASAAEYVCTERAPLTSTRPRPSVDGGTSLFIGGKLTPWEGKVVDVLSPVYGEDGTQAVIGSLSAMDGGAATTAARAAAAAWDLGQGPWPQSSLKDRAAALGAYLDELEATARDAIIETLMWEIAKSEKDAAKEFDRTVAFARTVIATALEGDAAEPFGAWTGLGGVRGRVRRGPVGVALMLAPFNYPLNEMYAMMMPALLMGNCVILKLPAIGALAHVLTIEAIRKTLPPGVVNFVSGSGRATLPSVMASGVVFSQLEGKNLGVVFADADLDAAADQIVLGALSYNGQRCTAIKLVVAHASVADALVAKLEKRIDGLKRGLRGTRASTSRRCRSPKPAYLTELIADAVKHGAAVVNDRGGDTEGQLFHPALVYPVTAAMRLFHEEQFGPVVPVATYEDLGKVVETLKHSWNGQQAALFTEDPVAAAPLVDALSTIVGRVNVNMQCARGPDAFPFSGRRSSAMGPRPSPGPRPSVGTPSR